MIETNVFRKNKINLKDYDYQKDIQNRLLLSHFPPDYLEILEEIIYSPPVITLARLADQLDKSLEEIETVLDSLAGTDLFKIEEGKIVVNKEMRKYFETQIMKFEEDFTPGMEFLQALLKKVPIHVLPNWYPIPRTSNNIFNSLIEKYLNTPQVYQRYLAELNLGDETLTGILKDIFDSPNYQIYSEDLRKKYSLSAEKFEEHMLYLEFNFLCCLIYEKREGEWVEVVTLFKEWKDYLGFLKETQPKEIEKKGHIKRTRPTDLAFAEDMSAILTLSMTRPLHVRLDDDENWVFEKLSAKAFVSQCQGFDLKSEEGQCFFSNYTANAIKKLLFLKLAQIEKGTLLATNDAEEWLSLPIEKRAFNTYKLTLSHFPFSEFPPEICSERNIREIEKTIGRIIDSEWVFLEDFLSGIIAPISDNSKMFLKKTGRYWKYTLPDYSDKEVELFKKVVYEWLFEAGVVATGFYEGKECLKITPLGQSLFG